MKKQHSRVYKQRRVWAFMRRHPEGVSRFMVMQQFDLTEYAASNLLQRLKHQGCATRTGSIRWPTWYATDKEPEDRRGLNTASLANIRRGQNTWIRGLVAAAIKRGRDPEKLLDPTPKKQRQPKRLTPSCALAHFWSMPKSRTLVNESDYDSFADGKVAPAENVEAA